MKTWTATTTVDAGPEAVLDVLTDPDLVARWAPVPFDVEVHEADPRRLALAANGPVGLDVAYDLSASGDGSEVHASISVRSGRGLTGRLLAEATNALLSTGALTHAISRLAAQAACPA